LWALFLVLIWFVGAAIYQGRSYLRLTHAGLEAKTFSHTRKIAWPEIRGFRLSTRQISVTVKGKRGRQSLQCTELTGHVRVVLERGEFVLPDRYGASPAKLLELLKYVRAVCLGESLPDETALRTDSSNDLTPVLQLSDYDALTAAGKHLSERGYSGAIVPASEFGQTDAHSWISADSGGYVLCLSSGENLQEAMLALAEFLSLQSVVQNSK
jgi:hypothetical protein